MSSLTAEALTVADLGSPGLSEAKEGPVEVEVQVSEAAVGGEEETNPN